MSKSKNQQLLCVKLGWREHFDPKELELLNAGAVEGLLRPYAVKGSKNNVLQYDISAFTTLQFYLGCILGQQQFVELIRSCIVIFRAMQRRYLHIERLLSGFEQIYIQMVKKRVYFIYVPIVEQVGTFSLPTFFQQLIDQTTCSDYNFTLFAEQYRNFLHRPTAFSLHEFEAFIGAISVAATPAPPVPAEPQRPSSWYGQPQQSGGYYIPTPTGPSVQTRQAPAETGTVLLGEGGTVLLEAQGTAVHDSMSGVLTRTKNGEQTMVDHTPFVIGRESGRADLAIMDNPTIGRVHAVIIVRENHYYLKDHGSLNKSYLNGAVLEPEREYPLEDGAQIRLSNEEFIFQIVIGM